jgi:hypothetical protein
MTSRHTRSNKQPDDDDQLEFFGELFARTVPDARTFVSYYQRSSRPAPIYAVQKPQYGRPNPPQHPWQIARETLACIYDDEFAFKAPAWVPPDLKPIACELANGHTLKIKANYWIPWGVEELMSGIRPMAYFSIRVYCTENCLPKRLHRCEEFRAGVDFHILNICDIWQWLLKLTQSRAIFDYDDFDVFVYDLADYMGRNFTAESDTVSHFEDLAWISAPKWFDRVDDSIFNDQTG